MGKANKNSLWIPWLKSHHVTYFNKNIKNTRSFLYTVFCLPKFAPKVFFFQSNKPKYNAKFMRFYFSVFLFVCEETKKIKPTKCRKKKCNIVRRHVQ